MNMEHLRTFLTVATYRNISKAAEVLYVPQPTVSNRIQFLEESLGNKLFTRGKRGVTLTEAGETFLPFAHQMLNMMNTATELLNCSNDRVQLKIASVVPFTYPLILTKIKELSKSHQNLNIVLLNSDQDEALHKLTTQEIDVAFVVEPVVQQGLECHRIGAESIELIVSSDHHFSRAIGTITAEDLAQEHLIYYEPYYHSVGAHLMSVHNPYGTLITNQIGVVKQLVIQNAGITFLPPFTVKSELERGDLVRLSVDIGVNSLEYYLIYRTNERYYEEILLNDLTHEMLRNHHVSPTI